MLRRPRGANRRDTHLPHTTLFRAARGPLFTGADLRAQLFAARNDLQRPAIAGCPAIADALTELGGLSPWLARMSGSGATCFALFDAAGECDAAALSLAARRGPQSVVQVKSVPVRVEIGGLRL